MLPACSLLSVMFLTLCGVSFISLPLLHHPPAPFLPPCLIFSHAAFLWPRAQANLPSPVQGLYLLYSFLLAAVSLPCGSGECYWEPFLVLLALVTDPHVEHRTLLWLPPPASIYTSGSSSSFVSLGVAGVSHSPAANPGTQLNNRGSIY